MQHFEEALDDHFCCNVLASASRLQSTCPTAGQSTPVPFGMSALYTADEFGEELMDCIQGLPPVQVTCSAVRCSICHYPTALDLLHSKCLESYSAIWDRIALYMFTYVLQVNMWFLHVQTRCIQCYIIMSALAVG